MGRPIPEIRARLFEIAKEIGGELGSELNELAEDTRRNAAVTSAPPVRGDIIAEDVINVRRLHKTHPHLGQHEIAVACNLNIGRVSEILTGRRGDNGKMIKGVKND